MKKWAEAREPRFSALRIPTVLPSYRLLSFEKRPLRRLSSQVLQRIGQVIAVVKQVDAPGALLQQEREQGGIRLGGVTRDAGEYQVIGSIVRGLASARADMVKRDHVR
jgi:hypothetical protein